MKKLFHPAVGLRLAMFGVLGTVLIAAGPAAETAPAAGDVAAPVAAAALPAAPVTAAPVVDSVVRRSSAAAALHALAPHVKRMSSPSALETALRAYYAYSEAHPEDIRNPYFYFVDLGLDNRTARGYVFDMNELELVEGPFMVAHGRGSGKRNGVPTSFSNRGGSYASSLGLYVTQETYTFTGKSSGVRYASVGLRMRGESDRFNDAARARGVVAHGAPYVTPREAGRSEGCPAMEMKRANRLLPMIANGGIVFVYSPNDPRWLAQDPWVNAD